ncbi:MAG: DUF1415 domain-containing protein [Stenotrophobium sp.]
MNGAGQIEQDVRRWLDQAVIGLNLCPFAAKPYRDGQVRISVSEARTEEALLNDLQAELALLDGKPAAELETTLLAVPRMLADFDAYNQFLNLVDALLEEFDWAGTYQVASFHPHYQFAGTQLDAAENLTNRSPCPILHLLREASLDAALESYQAPEQIPERNIRKVESLSLAERRKLFPYLFTG